MLLQFQSNKLVIHSSLTLFTFRKHHQSTKSLERLLCKQLSLPIVDSLQLGLSFTFRFE